MEKKTIGGFICALRKANGLTQKQLAEKLNVSDKAVSRWERDEAMPDLSLIPELAEIFGVTSDEILRGERRNPESEAPVSGQKSDRQRKRILTDMKTKYRIRSTVAIGIAVLGLIAAMICNFGFLRAYIGFMVSTVFYAAAVICQIIFMFLNLSGLDEDMVTEAERNAHRAHTVKLGCISFGVVMTLLAFSLPLVTLPYDTYQGINIDAWALYGLFFGVIGLLVCWVASMLAEIRLIKKGFLGADSRTERVLRLRGRFIGLGAAILAGLLFGQLLLNSFLPNALRQGIYFDDWDSFKAYMETPNDFEYYVEYDNGITVGVASENVMAEPSNYPEEVFFDENGNILEEEPPNQIRAEDGTVLCEYYHRNGDVSSWSWSTRDPAHPDITVYTTTEVRRAEMLMSNLVNPCYCCLYPLAILMLYLAYRKKVKEL